MRFLSLILSVTAGLLALAYDETHAVVEPSVTSEIGFNPTIGSAQKFRVTYRQRHFSDPHAPPVDTFGVDYMLAMTPTREKDGYRLGLLVSDVKRSANTGINMVVAAVLMLDGLPFDMLVDGRGFLKEAADWSNLQRELLRRADALPREWRGVARSVADGHTAHQVAWHLARAIEIMNFARSYRSFATRYGSSTIKWHGGLLVDVTVEPPDGAGNTAVAWSLPSGKRQEGEGHGIVRRDGFVAPLTMTTSSDDGRTREIHEIEPVPAD